MSQIENEAAKNVHWGVKFTEVFQMVSSKFVDISVSIIDHENTTKLKSSNERERLN